MDEHLPSIVRVSIGSAIHLGLARGTLDAKPTTSYLLSYTEGKCVANCAFCSQARESSSRADMLSRVTWPKFPTKQVVEAIGLSWKRGRLQRTCIQTMNYPAVFRETLAMVRAIKQAAAIPISVSCMPFHRSQMEQLYQSGVERIGIPLDAATSDLFDKTKGMAARGPYRWGEHMLALREAVEVFGRGRVSTHLMVGLGERDRDLMRMIQTASDMGVYPALFTFTPIAGSRLEKRQQPDLRRYHKIQMGQALITKGQSTFDKMVFDPEGRLMSFGADEKTVREMASSGLPFMTSGCQGCNRPYYNERPGGKIYNYPAQPKSEEAESIAKDILGEL